MSGLTRTTRSAFSLLEMVLSLALAMVLLLALYLTLSTYLTTANVGRDTLADGEVARGVMARISNDITNQLGAYDTRALPDYSETAGTTTPAASGTTPTTPTAPVNTDGVVFNTGVFGDATSLTLSTYRVEKPPAGVIANQPDTEIKSDLRRVNYWLVVNGADTLGLARREIKLATGNDIDMAGTDGADQEKSIIAREVKGITFEYFDGMAWQASWDGGELVGETGVPRGPPAAIKMTVTVRRASNKLLTFGAESTGPDLTYVHVVALPGGNNFTPKTANP